MKKFLMVLGVFLLQALPIFSSIAGAQTVSFTGSVKSSGSPGTAIVGATIELVGNSSINTTSDGSGNFTLSGLPSGPECALKVSKTGFVPAYLGNIPTTSNFTSPRPFTLFTSSQVSSWGVTAGKSAIVGRVIDGANPQTGYIGGAVITYTSALHPGTQPYTVGYQDSSGPIGGTATYPATGKFYILNVDDGDTVTVTVSAQGWTFAPITFVTHVDGISEVVTCGVGGQTISFTGSVKDTASPGNAIAGATIEMIGNASLNTTSDASGNFTLSGLPSGTTFSLKVSKTSFVPVYSSNVNSTSDVTSPRPFSLFTSSQVSSWGVTAGKSAIMARVLDNANPQTGFIGGAVVTFTSTLHPTNPPYSVGYQDSSGPIGGTATYPATGKFYILNVDDGDTVTVSASAQGWTFTPKTFVTHVDGISQGPIYGTGGSPPTTISATGQVLDANTTPNPVNGVTVEMVGNSSLTTTTDASGIFTLAGLPSGQDFHLKFTKSGFVPSYTKILNSTQNFSMTDRPHTLFTSVQMANFASAQGKGVITARVINGADGSNIDGATVSYTSSQGYTYRVAYSGGGQTTGTDGRYRILDIEDGDAVSVTATKTGWTFSPTVFATHADGVMLGCILGAGGGGGNTFSLSAGWNFVSFSKQPPDTAIGTVLSGILSDIKAVWGFDNDQKAWKLYKPGGANNTLATLEQGKGYWVYVAADHTLDLTSWTSASSQVHLYEGWNLVGYSGTNSAGIISSLTGVTGWQIAWAWIGSTWKADSAQGLTLPVPPVSTFEQGRAYWIKMGTGASGDWSQ